MGEPSPGANGGRGEPMSHKADRRAKPVPLPPRAGPAAHFGTLSSEPERTQRSSTVSLADAMHASEPVTRCGHSCARASALVSECCYSACFTCLVLELRECRLPIQLPARFAVDPAHPCWSICASAVSDAIYGNVSVAQPIGCACRVEVCGTRGCVTSAHISTGTALNYASRSTPLLRLAKAR